MRRSESCEEVTLLAVVLSAFLLSACSSNSTDGADEQQPIDGEQISLGVDSSDPSILPESPTPTPTPTRPPSVSMPGISPEESTILTENRFCENLNSTSNSVAIPLMDKPSYLESYIDPAFGSRVTRITDSSFGQVNKPAYSTMQAWNSDESLLLLYKTGVGGAAHKLVHGHNYEFVKNLDIYPSDLEQVYWSHSDPELLYYISNSTSDYGKLIQLNVATDSSTELADFTEHCGAGVPTSGNDVQMHSVDDDVFGFRCRQDDGHYNMLSYRRSTGQVITAPIGTGSNWSEWTAPAPSSSGTRFWYQGFVVGNDLQNIEHELDMAGSSEHSSTGMTYNGQDAYYQTTFDVSPNGCDGDLYDGVGHLVEHNMETGECRNIISQEQGYPYTTSGTHVSAQAYLKPERVAVSSIGRLSQFDLFTNGIPAPALLSEVYVAQTIPDDTKVCRLAHHRSYGKSATKGGYTPYFGEPHATISPSGTRIVFGSDWYDSGSVDSYVVELSDYVRP